MLISTEFACGSYDPCFNGGVCTTLNASFSMCVCNSATVGADLSWFHDPSCTLPHDFFRIQFIEQTILCWILAIILVRVIHQAKEIPRRMTVCSLLASLSMWSVSLGTFVQSGSFELTGFAYSACLIFSTLVGLDLIELQTSVLNNLDGYRVFRRTLQITTVAWFTSIIIIMILWIVFCRGVRHNRVVVAALISLVAANVIYGACVVRSSTQLLAEISKSQSSLIEQGHASDNAAVQNKLANVVRTLGRLRLAIVVGLSSVLAGGLPLIVMHLSLGSTPYGWVFVFAAMHSTSALSCGVIVVSRRRGEGPRSKDSITPKE